MQLWALKFLGEVDDRMSIGEFRDFHQINAQSFLSGIIMRLYPRRPGVGMTIPHCLGGLLGTSDRAARYFGDDGCRPRPLVGVAVKSNAAIMTLLPGFYDGFK